MTTIGAITKKFRVGLFFSVFLAVAIVAGSFTASAAKPDRQAPSSTITSPATGAAYNLASSATISITGSATDNNAVSGIEVSTDGGSTWNAAACTGCGTTDAAWTYSWTLPAEQYTQHNILSRATDSSGNLETPGAGVTVSIDRVRPSVNTTIPSNNSTAAVDSDVTVNWDENVDCSTVTTSNITISPGTTWALSSCSGSQAVFTASGQAVGVTYTVTVGTNVMDASGNAMAGNYQFSYTTIDPPPVSAITSPADGTTYGLASASPVTISGEATDNAAVSGVEVSTDGGSTWNAATCTGCGTANAAWTYSWALPAEQYTQHNILSRATDSSGNLETPGAGVTVSVDRIRPSVSYTSPANGGTAPVNSTVTITWNENVDCGTVNTSNVTISGGTLALSSCAGSRAIFTADGQSANSTYTVTVGTNVTDTSGNAMAGNYQFSYTASGAAMTSPSETPASGIESAGGVTTPLDITTVQAMNDGLILKTSSPAGTYDESTYEEFHFNSHLCDTASFITLQVEVYWQVKGAQGAKLEVYTSSGTKIGEAALTADGSNNYYDEIKTIAIPSAADADSLIVRFLAHDGTPIIDYVSASLNFVDDNVCIYRNSFAFAQPGTSASFPHIIYGPPGSTVDLSAVSRSGLAASFYLDADMNGEADNPGSPVTQVTLPASGSSPGFTGVVADMALPADFAGSDVSTVTAQISGQSASSVTDTSSTPADGLKDAEYNAPYATREFFDYGPDPNMASGELLSYVKDGLLHVYYAQNPRNINDNTYGEWTQAGWGGPNNHTLDELAVSDKTEFIFYDESGNVKLDFFSDYVSQLTGATAQYPGGYHSCGFMTTCPDGSASDGSMLINNTIVSDSDLAKYISIESSEAYNINHYTQTAGGPTQVDCGSPYGTIDLKQSSPPINRTTYALDNCPAAADFQFSYAIELVIPIAEIFPNEPIINIVARAHNSPSKNDSKNNPPTPATASIGDYVWYDMNGDGVQDSWETGIPNVRVVLYWDKNGDGQFSPDEELLETRTNSKGYYLFDGIYGGQFTSRFEGLIDDGQYKVWVDESTIPPGFVVSYPPSPNNARNYYVLSDTIPGADRGSLGYDENCRSADFGYRPEGGIIGDYVWYDANQNGAEDAGELGIADVTVDLVDSGGAVVGSTTTNSQGKYFFSGLDAGTYTVHVTDTGNVLSGYTHIVQNQSKPNPTADITIPVNGVYLDADFGYYNPAYCATGDIDGRVFFDQDWDKTFDGSDSGLSGVDVSIWEDLNGDGLLDSTDTFIGSTITDTTGSYHFSGLPVTTEGVHYIVQVTSQLTGYSKFYPSDGLTAFLTSGVCNSTLDFPYVAAGAVGDLVWDDINHNGVQDAGEPGIAGVTIQAQYCDTLSGSCSNTYTYDTTTDSQGHYMFSGLPAANSSGTRFRISVTDTAGVLSGWSQSPVPCVGSCTSATDSNNPSGTDVIIGGNSYPKSDMTIDFGYYNQTATYGSIGDLIWLDSNSDGLFDNGETGINGVTLELHDAATDAVLQTTTTSHDATKGDGWYTFSGLQTGKSYKVVITDLDGILSGYSMTTNPQVLNVTLPDTTRDTVTQGLNVMDADAGFYTPTWVQITDFKAYADNGRVAVKWQTASEINTVGFYLLRLDNATGRYEQVNKDLIPAFIGSPRGGSYHVIDEGAVPGATYSYKLLEVETKGAKTYYGPFRVTAAGTDVQQVQDSPVSGIARKANGLSDVKKGRIAMANETRNIGLLLRRFRTGDMIKIPVVEGGLYYLDAARISSLLGVRPIRATNMIRSGRLAMSNMGEDVAYLPAADDSGIYFYGKGIDSIFTNENVYWLYRGKGTLMKRVKGTGPYPAGPNETFVDSVRADKDVVPVPSLFSDPDADYWFWDYLYSGIDGMDTKTFTITAHGVSGTGSDAVLTAHLQSSTDTPAALDHHVLVKLNGTVIGEDRWDGTEPHTLTMSFRQSLLEEGDNTVTVEGILDPGIPYDLILVNSFDLNYSRLYRAENDALLLRGDGNQVASVSGFTDPDISVFDVTDPIGPKKVLAASITGAAGNYTVSFVPSSPQATYLAVASDAVKQADDAQADDPSTLRTKDNRADYLIITAKEFLDAVKPLSDYRKAQGLDTMVVDEENIFDEFNYGVYNPKAIKDFISYAYNNWNEPPEYVLLVGEGTYDYRNIYGYGDNFVPAMMTATPYGLFPSDGTYADANGDDIPDMAVGRLPVVDTEELSDVIGKIIQYEGSAGGQWQRNIVMAAGKADQGAGDFPADSDSVAALLPSGYSVEKVYLSELPLTDARRLLRDDLNSGALFMNYIGHGSVDRLANEGLFLTGDVDSLTNGAQLPVVTAMTCFMNNFSYPGTDSLGEALLLGNNRGAAAVWGPTGLSLEPESIILDKAFFQTVFTDGERVLGKAVLSALRTYGKNGNDPFMLRIYNLLGDPALRLR